MPPCRRKISAPLVRTHLASKPLNRPLSGGSGRVADGRCVARLREGVSGRRHELRAESRRRCGHELPAIHRHGITPRSIDRATLLETRGRASTRSPGSTRFGMRARTALQSNVTRVRAQSRRQSRCGSGRQGVLMAPVPSPRSVECSLCARPQVWPRSLFVSSTARRSAVSRRGDRPRVMVPGTAREAGRSVDERPHYF